MGRAVKWTEESILLEVAKYTSIKAFRAGSKSAYNKAYRIGILNSICTHMVYQHSSTDLTRPMYVYYVRITELNTATPDVWKIGITKHSDILRRFSREFSPITHSIDVVCKWYYPIGYDAYNIEGNIIQTYQKYRYTGNSPLKETGTTEMFSIDILAL